MFFNDKPIDWLLEYFINTRVCNWDKDAVNRISNFVDLFTRFYKQFLFIFSHEKIETLSPREGQSLDSL